MFDQIINGIIGAICVGAFGALGFFAKEYFSLRSENHKLNEQLNQFRDSTDSRKKCKNCNTYMSAKTKFEKHIHTFGQSTIFNVNVTEFNCKQCKSHAVEYEKASN
ncbi:MAG: hypothetical protein ACK41T_00720 [Pseudobdellovibrio sp.]